MKKFNGYAGSFAASVALTILVLGSELLPVVKTALVTVFTHHWIGKAVLTSLAFLLVGFGYHKKKIFGVRSESLSWYGILGSFFIIFVFFAIHYLIQS